MMDCAHTRRVGSSDCVWATLNTHKNETFCDWELIAMQIKCLFTREFCTMGDIFHRCLFKSHPPFVFFFSSDLLLCTHIAL
mmetsp:Transcript_21925/g.33459  ORF Transcript_21925/g.33459 Transcript_21925/m.33459 type:complete len:81 (+) Transcript_21925:180-422(+)